MKKQAIAIILLFLAASCSGPKGTAREAQQLLRAFLKPGADRVAMSNKLKPTKKDYLSIFKDPQDAEKANSVYESAWNKGMIVIRPKPGQTALLLWSASSEDIQAWRGDAKLHFPGGYQRIADKLKSGLTVYRWKFVKAGEKLGMASDGLYFANGHWFIVPKPWRALR